MDAQAARLNNKDLVVKLDDLERTSKRLKDEAGNAAKQDKSIDKAKQEEMKQQFDRLGRSVKEVRSRIDGDRPASDEIKTMPGLASDVGRSVSHCPCRPQGKTSWSSIATTCGGVAKVFGESWAGTP